MLVQYRTARMQDLPAVWAVIQNIKTVQRERGHVVWDEKYPTEAILQEDIARGDMVLGEIQGEIACLYVLNTICDDSYIEGEWEDPTAPFFVLHRFCVSPAMQGRGLSRLALHHAEQQAREQGGRYIHMDCCLANTAACHLYASEGYHPVGTILPPWDNGPYALLEKLLV